MPHSYYDVSDTNVDSYNTVLPCSKDEPYSMLFSDNIPAISFSNLNANAEEYIPTGTSNNNAYFNNAINPRVGAIVAVSYILAMLTLNSLGFFKIHLPKVKPKDLIKNIKYNHPNNIVLGHLNINSLRNKFHCLKYIVCDNIDILLLSESKLNQSFPDSQFAMDGFQMPFRADRNDKGGGLLLYVKEDIPCKIISVNFISEFEAIVLEVNLKKRKWLLLGIYNPHKEMTNTFLNIVGNSLNELCLKYENITIIGDFNWEMGDEVMGNFCNTYNFRCLVKEATCFKNVHNPSCIYLILTNRPLSFQNTNVIETGLSDFHKLTLTVMKSTFQKQVPKIFHFRNYKRCDNTLFQYDLMYEISNVGLNDISCEQFENIFMLNLNRHAPSKTRYVRANHSPFTKPLWLDQD